jgi:pimeloyl-ACP methyl ester carboxylesterase
VTDADTTAGFRRMVPGYFADYWRNEDELAPLRAEATLHADPLRGEDPAPFDARAELGAIEVRTLVVAGRHDPICPPRWAQQLHAGIRGSRLVVFEDSGHFPHVEEPREFARAVAGFVRGARSAGAAARWDDRAPFTGRSGAIHEPVHPHN